MPKIYKEHYLKSINKEQLIEIVLAWQEDKSDKIHKIIYDWAGKLIGRKINNVHPGPPEPLEQIVEKIKNA